MPAEIDNTELSGMLKNVYSDLSVNAFPKLNSIVAQYPKAAPGGVQNFQWGGNGVRWNVRTNRPVGATWSQKGYLAKHAQVNEEQAVAQIRRLYVTREIDNLLNVATDNKRKAYRTILQKVIGEAKDAYALAMAEAVQGDGTAVKGLVTSVTSTTQVDVSSPYGIAGAGQGGLHLAEGMFIAVLDTSAGNAVLGKATVTEVTNVGDTATVKWDTAISGMAGGDKIVPATANDTAFESAPEGLLSMSNRGGSYATLNGLSCTTFPHLAPVRMVAGTNTPDADLISEDDIWQLQQRVRASSGFDPVSKPDDFIQVTTTGLYHKLGQSFYGQREWAMAPAVTLNGGFKAVRICGVPVLTDDLTPAGTFYLDHKKSTVMIDAKDFGQVGFQDANVWRPIEGRDAYQTSYSHFMNLAKTQRNAMGSITGYTDTERYTFVK